MIAPEVTVSSVPAKKKTSSRCLRGPFFFQKSSLTFVCVQLEVVDPPVYVRVRGEGRKREPFDPWHIVFVEPTHWKGGGKKERRERTWNVPLDRGEIPLIGERKLLEETKSKIEEEEEERHTRSRRFYFKYKKKKDRCFWPPMTFSAAAALTLRRWREEDTFAVLFFFFFFFLPSICETRLTDVSYFFLLDMCVFIFFFIIKLPTKTWGRESLLFA